MIGFWEKTFILLIVLSSGALISVDYSLVKILMIGIFFLLIIKREISTTISKKLLIAIIFTSFLWVFQSIFYSNEEIIGDSIRTSLIFIIIMLYANMNPERNVARVRFFYYVVLGFTIISGILYICILANVNFPTISTSISRDTVFYLQTYTGGNIVGNIWYRNCGIFWEPGLYQVFLNFSLLYVLYILKLKKSTKIIHITIIMLSILSTGSLMGYFIASAIWLVYLLTNSSSNMQKVLRIVTALFVAIIVFPKLSILLDGKRTTESYSIRFNDIKSGFEVFASKPLLGYGICNNAFENKYFNTYGIFRGSSNGLINALISFGSVGFIFYMLLMIKYAKWFQIESSSKVFLPFFIWLIGSLISEPISPMPFIFLFLGIGFAHFSSKKLVV